MLVTVHEGERKFRIDVLVLDTGARHTVVEEGFDARYVSTGHIVYATGTTLFAAPFDLDAPRAVGADGPVTDGVSTDPREGQAGFAVSDTGTLVYLPLPRQRGEQSRGWIVLETPLR